MHYTLKISGSTHTVNVLGRTVVNILKKGGLHVFGWSEAYSEDSSTYGAFYITVSKESHIEGLFSKINILVALCPEAVAEEWSKLNEQAIIFADNKVKISKFKKQIKEKKFIIFEVPSYTDGTKKKKQTPENIKQADALKLIASLLAFLGIDKLTIKESIVNYVSNLSLETKAKSVKIVESGVQFIRSFLKKNKKASKLKFLGVSKNAKDKYTIDGIKMIAAGAAESKCKMFFFDNIFIKENPYIYKFFKHNAYKFNMEVKETSTARSSLSQTMAVNLTGKRALALISSNNYDCCEDLVAFSSQAEIPLVVLSLQFTDSAKLTLKHVGQNYLLKMIYNSLDKYPKMLMTPGSITDLFSNIQTAFNFSEKYQMPVILAVDQFLINSITSFNNSDIKSQKIERGAIQKQAIRRYKRYKITKDGISERSLFGSKLLSYYANAHDHDEYGKTSLDMENKIKMEEKLMKKYELLKEDLPEPTLLGPRKSDITIISFGSTKGSIAASLKNFNLKNESLSTNFIHFETVQPLNTKIIKELNSDKHHFIVIENNPSGQFERYLTSETGIQVNKKILKYNGRPFFIDELC